MFIDNHTLVTLARNTRQEIQLQLQSIEQTGTGLIFSTIPLLTRQDRILIPGNAFMLCVGHEIFDTNFREKLVKALQLPNGGLNGFIADQWLQASTQHQEWARYLNQLDDACLPSQTQDLIDTENDAIQAQTHGQVTISDNLFDKQDLLLVQKSPNTAQPICFSNFQTENSEFNQLPTLTFGFMHPLIGSLEYDTLISEQIRAGRGPITDGIIASLNAINV